MLIHAVFQLENRCDVRGTSYTHIYIYREGISFSPGRNCTSRLKEVQLHTRGSNPCSWTNEANNLSLNLQKWGKKTSQYLIFQFFVYTLGSTLILEKKYITNLVKNSGVSFCQSLSSSVWNNQSGQIRQSQSGSSPQSNVDVLYTWATAAGVGPTTVSNLNKRPRYALASQTGPTSWRYDMTPFFKNQTAWYAYYSRVSWFFLNSHFAPK